MSNHIPPQIMPDHMSTMEAELAAKGIPVAELCRQADIAETTWWRWREGKFNPNFQKWRDVSLAYQRLTGAETQSGAA